MSTLFHWLCNPVFLFVLLLLIAWLLKVLKRQRGSQLSLVAAIGWIVLVGSTPLPQGLIYFLEKQSKPFDLSAFVSPYPEYVLVLGGGHTISPKLPAGLQLSGTAVVRLAEGMRVRNLLGGGKLVCSGSSATRRTTQAEMLAQAALELGISPGDTIQLRSPKRTTEELNAFKSRFRQSPVVVVTSARHMPRVMMVCRREGLTVWPAPTDFLLKEDPQVARFDFYPSTNKLVMMESALHEYMGMAELWTKELFN